ncbi:MAG: class I SAM-dependent rRNA methyltransferase [Bacteroidales bacterium]
MDRIPMVIVKPGKEAAVIRRHPWIFSGAIDRKVGDVKEGCIVEVFSSDRKYLGTGHYLNGSIAVKVFSFLRTTAGYDFWLGRLRQAFELRKKADLTNSNYTNAYRLVFSEGDELPGLIIDWYNGVAVIQTHSLGMHNVKPMLVEALKELYGEKLVAVYDKSAETMARSSQNNDRYQISDVRYQISDGFLYGSCDTVQITEIGHTFKVDFVNGQKTGFFIDQRSNRMFAQFYAKNRKVLNAFCYSGAFSVYCLKGGATHVQSVDSSKQAIEWTKENLALNGFEKSGHSEDVAEMKFFLKDASEKYGMIILDPPAFAKTHLVSNNALHAYIQLNASAIRHLEPGGLLFTFSCSQAVNREMFRSALQSAAIETGRNVKILHHLSQGPDHPVSIYHPEGEYLKGLILEVD